ncbi:MAG: RnfABCDGE type electron transport complex subunit D [Anaerovoracaceae bacterium]
MIIDKNIISEEKNKQMAKVILSLFPALVAAAFIFGARAMAVTLFCVVICISFEWFFSAFIGKKKDWKDLSPIVTGIILAFMLPANIPFWIAAIGCFFAIIVAKELFGGFGNNFVNPALMGKVFLMVSFPMEMTNFPFPNVAAQIANEGAKTPLHLWVAGATTDIPSTLERFLGYVPGGIGEVSCIAIIIGALFLMWSRTTSPAIPIVFYVTIIGLAILFGGDPNYHIVSGPIIFAGTYLAADPETIPKGVTGQIFFAFGFALVTMAIRFSGVAMEGVYFALLFMNIFVPLFDKIPQKEKKNLGNDENKYAEVGVEQ